MKKKHVSFRGPKGERGKERPVHVRSRGRGPNFPEGEERKKKRSTVPKERREGTDYQPQGRKKEGRILILQEGGRGGGEGSSIPPLGLPEKKQEGKSATETADSGREKTKKKNSPLP